MRLASLARTHAMLADSKWTGAPLEQILSEELTSFANQVSFAGCAVVLNTPAAQTFALIVHELATNALKHGALSRPNGRVHIEGQMCDDNTMFRFAWIETDGPEVEHPQRKGFGSSILTGMAKRFAQKVEVTYRREGLIYELLISIASIQAFPQNQIEARQRVSWSASRATGSSRADAPSSLRLG